MSTPIKCIFTQRRIILGPGAHFVVLAWPLSSWKAKRNQVSIKCCQERNPHAPAIFEPVCPAERLRQFRNAGDGAGAAGTGYRSTDCAGCRRRPGLGCLQFRHLFRGRGNAGPCCPTDRLCQFRSVEGQFRPESSVPRLRSRFRQPDAGRRSTPGHRHRLRFAATRIFQADQRLYPPGGDAGAVLGGARSPGRQYECTVDRANLWRPFGASGRHLDDGKRPRPRPGQYRCRLGLRDACL